MRIVNDAGPWRDGLDRNLSIVDLLAGGTIPAAQAAILWWALERGASLLTAGGPSGAGKTTLANAALSFLPDTARVYVHAGRDDPLVIPAGDGPTYLLISEVSAHGRPHYLSGPAALRAFALLRDGTRIVGTMHADSVAEAVGALGGEFGLPAGDIARITLMAIVRVDGGRDARGRVERGRTDLQRRVVEIGLLAPDGDGFRSVEVAAWNAALGRLETAGAPGGIAALAAWSGLNTPAVEAAIRLRADILSELLVDGRRDPDEVAAAVRRVRAGTAS